MRILFDEHAIAREVARLAREIVSHEPRVELAVPILTGAFVFASDLVRALAREGLDMQVECISLSRYSNTRRGLDDIVVRMGAGDAAWDKHILLIDGVLDHGHTLVRARTLLRDAGARSVTIAVAVDKGREGALVKADYAAFSGVDTFIVGYGMDDAGLRRGLPYIAAVE
ncbi:MAG TPA: phosphoribosyltransferase family protein [Rhizomicrobium sp.]|nr:phosphoribosyltransferase family protein [Rhizomicrobium sp.]